MGERLEYFGRILAESVAVIYGRATLVRSDAPFVKLQSAKYRLVFHVIEWRFRWGAADVDLPWSSC